MTRTKAKARLRRAVEMVPVVGIAAAGYFEERDYQEWQAQNLDLWRKDYACEVSHVSAKVTDDVLQGLPQDVRPSREFLLSKLPECQPRT